MVNVQTFQRADDGNKSRFSGISEFTKTGSPYETRTIYDDEGKRTAYNIRLEFKESDMLWTNNYEAIEDIAPEEYAYATSFFLRGVDQNELDEDEIRKAAAKRGLDIDDGHGGGIDLTGIDLSELGIDIGDIYFPTQIGVCRAYQFYKVSNEYGTYSDFFALEDPKNKLDLNQIKNELTDILNNLSAASNGSKRGS